MEMPRYPEQDPGSEVLAAQREQLLARTAAVFKAAEQLDTEYPETYVLRYPLEVPDVDEVIGIMLTEDGRRPFIDETDKEYVMLFRPLQEQYFEQSDLPTVWIRERRRWVQNQGSERRYEERPYILNELGFQLYARDVEDLREDISTVGGKTEATEIRRMDERIQRFRLTPLQEPPQYTRT
jgi:hypothetical protein